MSIFTTDVSRQALTYMRLNYIRKSCVNRESMCIHTVYKQPGTCFVRSIDLMKMILGKVDKIQFTGTKNKCGSCKRSEISPPTHDVISAKLGGYSGEIEFLQGNSHSKKPLFSLFWSHQMRNCKKNNFLNRFSFSRFDLSPHLNNLLENEFFA